MNEPDESRMAPHTSAKFSLASLALTVTVITVLFASVNFDQGHEQLTKLVIDRSWYTWGLLGGATLVGTLVGWTHMFVNGFSWRALFLAPISGAVAGGIGVMILVAPSSLQRSALAVIIVLGTTMLFRLSAE